uniref:Tick transposon n=1 Tax=Rhipicephalus zambeziensis TaxID=60191 RepID=A0A224Z1C1_9ACAR
MAGSAKKNVCSVNYRTRFVTCVCGVVYNIPLTCGKVYIGQTGAGLNERLRQHSNTLKGTPRSHLSSHCRSCGCKPLFDRTHVIFRHMNQRSREIIEAFRIKKNHDTCISAPFIYLHDCEISLLEKT